MNGDKLPPMTVEPAEEPINADPTYAPLIEAERQAADDAARDDKGRGVLRFYELAKKQEWQVRDLPWGEVPPIPETRAGASAERKERRRAVWRSVITQQLQADQFAVEMAAQLLNLAPHPEAKLYYSTMVQDEARHTEAWLKLANEAGGVAERDPYLDELAKMTLEAETLEEKVFQMQVFFERLIIPRFRLIARSSRGTVLEDVCNRLTIDDGIHHSSGVAYERVLLEGRVEEDEGPARQGCEPAAADLRRACALAAEGARVDRERHARDGHSPAAGRRPGRHPDGVEPRPRRVRRRAPVRGIDRIPPHHDPACFGCGDHELGLRMTLPAAEGAETYASAGDVRRPSPGRPRHRARRHRRRSPRRGMRLARDLASVPHRHRTDRDPLPPAGADQPPAAGDRERRLPTAAGGSRSRRSSGTETSCWPRRTGPSCTCRSSTSSRRRRVGRPARRGRGGSTRAQTPRTGDFQAGGRVHAVWRSLLRRDPNPPPLRSPPKCPGSSSPQRSSPQSSASPTTSECSIARACSDPAPC